MTIPADDVIGMAIIDETEVGQDHATEGNIIEGDLDLEIETITDSAIEDRAGMTIIEDFRQPFRHALK